LRQQCFLFLNSPLHSKYARALTFENLCQDIIKWHFVLYFDRYMEMANKHKLVTGRSVFVAPQHAGFGFSV